MYLFCLQEEAQPKIFIFENVKGLTIGEAKEYYNKIINQFEKIGYDVSTENINNWDHHLARSKGADTFCVLGPWIDSKFIKLNEKIT